MACDPPSTPAQPFPISRISQMAERYFLYDSNAITWLRREHHMLGVLVGTLPQIPQQNVFLGIPLELQPEEARLLVEKGVAYIVDDLQWHEDLYTSMTILQRDAYTHSLQKQGQDIARANAQAKGKRSEQAFPQATGKDDTTSSPKVEPTENDKSSFNPSSPSQQPRSTSPDPSSTSTNGTAPWPAWLITPTTSSLHPSASPGLSFKPTTSLSYALFAHLHSNDYCLSPGLRFGCQFLVYPGDPLRFHSHFLANALGWDEEIQVMDLVGGGRLGTGVKKGWLIGGRVEEAGKSAEVEGGIEYNAKGQREVRTFCIEWGGL